MPAFGAQEIQLEQPLPGEETPTSIPGWVRYLYLFGLGIVGAVALIVLIYAGIEYILSGTNIISKDEAKKRIWSAITGLLILLFSYVILYTINPNLVQLKFDTLPTVRPVEDIDVQALAEARGLTDMPYDPELDRNYDFSADSSALTGGSFGQGVVDLANIEKNRGVQEIHPNHLQYSDGSTPEYNINNAWCAAFVSWLYKKNGIRLNGENLVTSSRNLANILWDQQFLGYSVKNQDYRIRFSSQSGDVVYFKRNGENGHMGVVEYAEINRETGDIIKIHTIEGNSGNTISRREYTVAELRAQNAFILRTTPRPENLKKPW